MGGFICEQCGPIQATHVVEREETLPVRGQDVTVQAKVRLCDVCDGEVYDEALDNATLTAAYDVYRRQHGVLSPDEIRSLRENYGLSQRSLSALLGLGDISIHRYENGSLPDEAHNHLLRFIQDAWNMQKLLDKNGHRLPPSTLRKLSERVLEIIWEETPDKVVELISAGSQSRMPSILTGFRPFSSETLMEMMVFLASMEGIYKTKLMKELWYSDFTYFHNHSTSISGATYHHLPFGPVPDGWSVFIDHLMREGALQIKEEYFDNGGVGELLVAAREPMTDVFPPDALTVLQATKSYFAPMSSRKISELSHQEPAYQETEDGEAISYRFADRLSVKIA